LDISLYIQPIYSFSYILFRHLDLVVCKDDRTKIINEDMEKSCACHPRHLFREDRNAQDCKFNNVGLKIANQ
jgi:hypothetical protein